MRPAGPAAATLPGMAQAYDVVVIGAGPAGMSAALELGRSRRRTLLLDGGPGRNAATHAAHGLYTRDGTPPAELHAIAREQLRRYGVEVREARATGGTPHDGGFELHLDGGQTVQAARLLLAYGVRDVLPPVPGLRERWGCSVLHCPYCDGWEHRDRRAAVYGTGNAAHHMALTLQLWTEDVVVLTDGPADFTPAQQTDLDRLGVRVIQTPLARLDGPGTDLACVYFEDGTAIERDLLVLSPPQEPASDLAGLLGCALDGHHVRVNDLGETTVPGVYAAGDLTGQPQYVVAAAAKGAMTAIALNTALIHAQLAERGVEFHKKAAAGPQQR